MLDTIGSASSSHQAPSFIEGAITIGALLAEADVFRIPSFYQRDLSWGGAQAEDLWHDLTKAMGAPDEAPVSQLLGQIVLAHVQQDSGGAARRTVDIVDGQQRLTTLATLLCCLRDRLEDASLAQRLAGLVLAGRSSPEAVDGRIELRTGLADVYRASVLQPGSTRVPLETDALKPDQRNLAEIRQAFIDRLDAGPMATEERRRNLAMLVLDHCHVARVLMRDARAAAETFIRINARGKSLLRTDRLKAHLVSKVALAEQEALAARWDAVKDLLDTDFDGEAENRKYLTSFLHDIHGNGGRIETTLRSLIDTQGAEKFLSDILEPTAKAYHNILHKSFDSGKLGQEINACLRYLNWLPRKSWIAPALKVMASHRREPPKVLEFLKALDRYAYGLAILGEPPKSDERRYSDIIIRLQGAKDSPASVLRFDDAELKSIGNRLHFSLGDDNIRLAKIVLVRAHIHATLLKEKKSRQAGVILAGEEMLTSHSSVDHLLPGNAEPDSSWAKLFTGEVDVHWKMIGNLFVVPDDLKAQLGENSWQEKKAVLAQHIADEGDILPFADMLPIGWGNWNKGSLIARQKKLSKCFKEMWGFPGE
jgi:hypothetical protein